MSTSAPACLPRATTARCDLSARIVTAASWQSSYSLPFRDGPTARPTTASTLDVYRSEAVPPYGCVGRQRRRTGLWPGHDTQNYRSISKGIFIRSSEFTHFPIFFFNPCKLRSQMYCSFFLDDVLYIVETRSKTGMLSISSSTQVKEK